MRVLVLLVVLLFPTLAVAGPTVAILDLENHTGDATLDPAGAGVAAILTSRFSKVQGIQLVERTQLTALLQEIKLGASGSVDKETAAQAGRVLGADYLVLGSMSSIKLPNLAVSLRMVRTDTGEIVLSEDVIGEIGADGSEFFVLIDELAFRVIDGLQVRLSAKERIALSQVSVQKLDTVRIYGGALKELDAGNTDAAETMLAEALSLEPGFTLAESTRQQIASEIKAERATIANADVQDAHAAFKKARIWVDANQSDTVSLDQARRRALHARLLLIEGDIAGYFKAEEQRAAWTSKHVRTMLKGSTSSHNELRMLPLLTRAGVMNHRRTLDRQMVLWPWQIRLQMAQLRNRLGQREQAIAEVIEVYQHPGPRYRADARLKRLDSTLQRMGAWDVVVLLRRQELQQAKREGHETSERRALKELDSTEIKAGRYRERVASWNTVQRGFSEPVTRQNAALEVRAINGATNHVFRADYVQYRAFRKRAEAGYYATIQAQQPRLWAELARAWYQIAAVCLEQRWFADQRLEHLLALHAQVPAKTDTEHERQQRALEDLIHRMYSK